MKRDWKRVQKFNILKIWGGSADWSKDEIQFYKVKVKKFHCTDEVQVYYISILSK